MAFAMVPWKRSSDLVTRRRDADRLFDDFFGWPTVMPSLLVGETRRAFVPQIDVTEGETAYTVTAELAGLSSEDFEVEVEDGVLTLKGEKQSQYEDDENGVRRQESRSGRFLRRIRFNTAILEDEVAARYRDGVLTITVPREQESRPEIRAVPVESA